MSDKPTTIDEVLRELQMVTHDNGYDTFDRVKAIDAIEQLILTEVIGEDLPYFDESSHTKTWRNGMRSPTLRSLINHTKEEQRQSLSNLMRGGGES